MKNQYPSKTGKTGKTSTFSGKAKTTPKNQSPRKTAKTSINSKTAKPAEPSPDLERLRCRFVVDCVERGVVFLARSGKPYRTDRRFYLGLAKLGLDSWHRLPKYLEMERQAGRLSIRPIEGLVYVAVGEQHGFQSAQRYVSVKGALG